MERLALTLDRALEATVRKDRLVVGGSLGVIVALAWLYLWHDARMMAMMPASGIAAGADAGLWRDAALTFAMWSVMMVGMMLPGVAPAVLLYAAIVRRNGERGSVLPGAWTFASGYLVVWIAFSAAATTMQLALQHATLLTPMMTSASRAMSAALLIAAGAFQWMPAKAACLSRCRNPLELMLTRWHPGRLGGFRMGAEHGAYCLGCCWALMLLLFVAGVMNLAWVALITLFVLAEKLAPGAGWMSRVAGVTMIGAGIVVALV